MEYRCDAAAIGFTCCLPLSRRRDQPAFKNLHTNRTAWCQSEIDVCVKLGQHFNILFRGNECKMGMMWSGKGNTGDLSMNMRVRSFLPSTHAERSNHGQLLGIPSGKMCVPFHQQLPGMETIRSDCCLWAVSPSTLYRLRHKSLLTITNSRKLMRNAQAVF